MKARYYNSNNSPYLISLDEIDEEYRELLQKSIDDNTMPNGFEVKIINIIENKNNIKFYLTNGDMLEIIKD